jgi:excisionase family DNA binding protein
METSCAAQLDFLDADLAPAVTGASIATTESAPPGVAVAPCVGACGSTTSPAEGRVTTPARESRRECIESTEADASQDCCRRQDCFRSDERAPAAGVERRRRGNERERGERETMNGIQTAELIGDRLLRINEVADCLRSSDKTVRRLIGAGKLRSLKVRGLRLVRASDLRALVEGATS